MYLAIGGYRPKPGFVSVTDPPAHYWAIGLHSKRVIAALERTELTRNNKFTAIMNWLTFVFATVLMFVILNVYSDKPGVQGAFLVLYLGFLWLSRPKPYRKMLADRQVIVRQSDASMTILLNSTARALRVDGRNVWPDPSIAHAHETPGLVNLLDQYFIDTAEHDLLLRERDLPRAKRLELEAQIDELLERTFQDANALYAQQAVQAEVSARMAADAQVLGPIMAEERRELLSAKADTVINAHAPLTTE